MQHLLRGLERHGIGHRAMTEDDFWNICHDEGIEVVLSRRRYAFYFTVPETDVKAIVLPERRTGPRLLFSMFHELAHHFLHGGDEPCIAFQGLSDSKCEAEADAVALIALMPRQILPELEWCDIEAIGFEHWKARERLALYGV